MGDQGLKDRMAAQLRAPFPPECAGRAIDGVELVVLDADVYGVATWYQNDDRPLTAVHRALLTGLIADLDRVWPKLPNEAAREYYAIVRELGAYLLATRGRAAST